MPLQAAPDSLVREVCWTFPSNLLLACVHAKELSPLSSSALLACTKRTIVPLLCVCARALVCAFACVRACAFTCVCARARARVRMHASKRRFDLKSRTWLLCGHGVLPFRLQSVWFACVSIRVMLPFPPLATAQPILWPTRRESPSSSLGVSVEHVFASFCFATLFENLFAVKVFELLPRRFVHVLFIAV